jgi:hypothetical protein
MQPGTILVLVILKIEDLILMAQLMRPETPHITTTHD